MMSAVSMNTVLNVASKKKQQAFETVENVISRGAEDHSQIATDDRTARVKGEDYGRYG